MKDQFSDTPNEDVASHLNTFVELCDILKKKYVDNDIVKLKLFPFSLRDHAKIWFSSLPHNSIDSWNKCKDAFITKYFPPAKIISLRNQIMNFKQLEHEHVAQSWERMKLMLRNCPTHGLNLWMIIQIFYAGLNFVSRNLFDSVAGGTFMEIILGEATKLLDNIMANYSQWHTERAPNSKNVNSVEEISTLSEKVDALMKLVASKSAPIDFNDVPLSTLIEQNSDAIDVNFISRDNFSNNAYRGNFNPRPFPSNSSNNYGNSYGNKSYNNNRNTSDLENNIKEFVNTQKVFNTTIEEKLNKIDDLSRSIDRIAHDVENLKLKVFVHKVEESIKALYVSMDESKKITAMLRARREFLEKAVSSDYFHKNDEHLKMIGVYSIDSLFSKVKIDNKGIEEESTLTRRRPNNSEGENLVEKID